jgi:oligoribonuclease NrnB/cAMP/cGMP phosphodiesterase (DHH superfamily)
MSSWTSSGPRNNLHDIVIFHKNCPDGSAGAWIYWSMLRPGQPDSTVSQTKFVPMEAGKYPRSLEVNGKNVLMIDVCPTREEIDGIAGLAKSLVILDHHKSGERDVEGITVATHPNVHIVFDMKRSGCQIAWDYFREGKRPWFLEVIADRDLWKWEYPDSKNYGHFLHHKGYYHNWDMMSTLLTFTDEQKAEALAFGKVLAEIEKREVDFAVKYSSIRQMSTPDGETYKVRLTGCSHSIASEVGNVLCGLGDCDFAVCYRYSYEKDEWWISCRTDNDKIDLSVLTRKLGGGGHPRASGFDIKNSKNALQDFFKKIE